MSHQKLTELIGLIEDLQKQMPPGPRGDNGPPRPGFKDFGWRDAAADPNHRPTVGGNISKNLHNAIKAAFSKADLFQRAGRKLQRRDLIQHGEFWLWRGSDLMDLAVEKYGWDAVWRMDAEDNPSETGPEL